MNETASTMKKEIRRIAGYRALFMSRYFITILLAILSLYLNYKHYPVPSLYILLFLNILPSILVYALKDYSKKSDNRFIKLFMDDNEFKLKLLKIKYKYSKVSYVANTCAYLLALFLLCLWQINYNRVIINHPILSYLPSMIIASGLAVRILGFFYYWVKIPYVLKHNKL